MIWVAGFLATKGKFTICERKGLAMAKTEEMMNHLAYVGLPTSSKASTD